MPQRDNFDVARVLLTKRTLELLMPLRLWAEQEIETFSTSPELSDK
jgi:hypothetical protein